MKTKFIILGFIFIQATLNFVTAQENPVTQIKILTFNIYHGETMNGDYNLNKIAGEIKKVNPDLVSLQEVDFKTNRNNGKDLSLELAYKTGMVPLFGKAMNFDAGEYGDAILSKQTFLSSRNLALPFTEGREPRTALEAVLVLSSGDTISFVSTHLDWLEDDTDRLLQVKRINKTFTSGKYPTILAGDLNDTPESRVIRILKEFWTPAYNNENPKLTFPSNNPDRKIDYIMAFPKERWEIISRDVICDSIASDHCAYTATLKLIPKK